MTLKQIEDGIYNNLTCYVDKPTDANNTIGETLRYMNTNNILEDTTNIVNDSNVVETTTNDTDSLTHSVV